MDDSVQRMRMRVETGRGQEPSTAQLECKRALNQHDEPRATLFADGGSRGNPGPAASGAVLVSPEGAILQEVGRFLGTATNNVAEWTALQLGLEAALAYGVRRLAVRLDSELVVKQLSGEYRVKHPDLQPLHRRVSALLRKFEHVDVRHVRRKENALADAVVNRVLDAPR